MPENIRVVVVDPYSLRCDALVAALGGGECFEVSAAADDAGEALDVITTCEPDVVVYAADTGGFGLVDALQEIGLRCPRTKILLLVDNIDENQLVAAVQAGARGYVGKDQNLNDLKKAIRCVLKGEHWVERRVMSRIIDQAMTKIGENDLATCSLPADLTTREREVLRCLIKGYSNKQIGDELFISEKTVKTHLGKIYSKLNITKRVEAILYVTANAFH